MYLNIRDVFQKYYVDVSVWFSVISAILYTVDNNYKYVYDVSNRWSPHLTLRACQFKPKHSTDKRLLYICSVTQIKTVGFEATQLRMLKVNHHTVQRSLGMLFFSMVLILGDSHAEHLNASWMALYAVGRIIENQYISEHHSLVVRIIQATLFSLWNSIRQPHSNSNKQL